MLRDVLFFAMGALSAIAVLTVIALRMEARQKQLIERLNRRQRWFN